MRAIAAEEWDRIALGAASRPASPEPVRMSVCVPVRGISIETSIPKICQFRMSVPFSPVRSIRRRAGAHVFNHVGNIARKPDNHVINIAGTHRQC